MPHSDLVGQYRLLAPISGRVYRGEHGRIGRVVAIKVLGDPRETRRRLAREGRWVSQICHDNVVAITDLIEQHGALFMVMELVPGCDLAELLRRERPLPLCRALPIALQICRGLLAVHQAGVAHGNLHTEHVCVWRGRVKLVGFGGAGLDGPALQADDLPAVGRVLQALFASGRGVPGALERLVHGCLAQEVARRPTAAELTAQLERMVATPTPAPPRAQRRVGAPSRWSSVAAALVGLLAALIVLLATAPPQRPPAALPAGQTVETHRPPTARVVLRTDPPGARVFRKGDLAVSLGRTPLELQLPNLGDLVEFVFHMDGYENASATVVVRHETHVGVELEPAHVRR